MTCLADDIAYFVRAAPYLELSRPARAARYLERRLQWLSECFTGLDAYPTLQVEPLDFFYVTARSLGMLDPGSLEVMTSELTWRGVVWGGFLALVMPNPAFRDVLAKASAHNSDNLWAVQCALALLDQRPAPAPLAHVASLAARVRDAVSTMRIERMPLRSIPTGDERALLEDQRRRVREAYESGGAQAALQVLRGTRLHEQSMPYARWCSLQRSR